MQNTIKRTGMPVALVTAAVLTLAFSTSVGFSGAFSGANLASVLGIGSATASRLLDLISTWWGAAAVAAAGFGWATATVIFAKSLIKRVGKAYATAW